MLVGFGALRLAQYVPAGVAATSSDRSVYLWPQAVFGLYTVAVVWSVGLFAAALRGRRIGRGAVVVDVLLMAVALVVVGRLTVPGQSVGWANWTVGPANAAGLFAAVFGPRSLAVPSVGLLVVCYLTGVWPDLTGGPPMLASVAGNAASLVLFTAAGGLAAAWVRSMAREVDRAHDVATEAATRTAAIEAIARERMRQYRALHDTVLSTLTVGAMGQIDLNTKQFRGQCERDARFLRTLISGRVNGVASDLDAGLTRVVRDMTALGLRIDHDAIDLPSRIPLEVTDAILGATREALNNARKHAGTGQAWLTARGASTGGVRITVVDRGCGFMVSAERAGYGLLGSIRHRVIEVGGQCDITSALSAGTTVEISWTP
jgi:signal transduction histidine kinase